jgi:hypothetical protein
MCKDKETGEIKYKAWNTIMQALDGEKGEDALNLVIASSNGNYFKNNVGNTTLTAKLFMGGQEVDVYPPHDYNY